MEIAGYGSFCCWNCQVHFCLINRVIQAHVPGVCAVVTPSGRPDSVDAEQEVRIIGPDLVRVLRSLSSRQLDFEAKVSIVQAVIRAGDQLVR